MKKVLERRSNFKEVSPFAHHVTYHQLLQHRAAAKLHVWLQGEALGAEVEQLLQALDQPLQLLLLLHAALQFLTVTLNSTQHGLQLSLREGKWKTELKASVSLKAVQQTLPGAVRPAGSEPADAAAQLPPAGSESAQPSAAETPESQQQPEIQPVLTPQRENFKMCLSELP